MNFLRCFTPRALSIFGSDMKERQEDTAGALASSRSLPRGCSSGAEARRASEGSHEGGRGEARAPSSCQVQEDVGLKSSCWALTWHSLTRSKLSRWLSGLLSRSAGPRLSYLLLLFLIQEMFPVVILLTYSTALVSICFITLPNMFESLKLKELIFAYNVK